ncbi:unnamed protein product, partial [Allacma fusca]
MSPSQKGILIPAKINPRRGCGSPRTLK